MQVLRRAPPYGIEIGQARLLAAITLRAGLV